MKSPQTIKLLSLFITLLLWTALAATSISVQAVSADEGIAKSREHSQRNEGPQTSTPELIVPTGHTSSVTSLAFSPNGTLLASTGFLESTIKLWDATTGRMLRTLTARDPQGPLAFSPDGKLLASAGFLGAIMLWNVTTGQVVHTLDGHTDFVSSVAFSSDGKTLVSGSGRKDRTIKLWEVATGEALKTLSGHTNSVFAVAFSADRKLLVSASLDKTIKLWDTQTWKELRTLLTPEDGFLSAALSPDGKMLASGGENSLRLWDLTTGNQVRAFAVSDVRGSYVTFSPDGRLLASSDGLTGNSINLWDVATGQRVRPPVGVTFGGAVVFSPAGMLLAYGDAREIRLWNFGTGERTAFKAEVDNVISTAFSADGRILACVIEKPQEAADATTTPKPPATNPAALLERALTQTRIIKLWDMTTGETLQKLSGSMFMNSSVVFSPDRKLLAVGGKGNSIKILDVNKGNEKSTLTGHTNTVSTVMFSPDNKMLVSVGLREVIFWDLVSGRPQVSFGVQEFFPVSLNFSADGKLLAAGGLRETRVWETPTGRLLHTLPGHQEFVDGVLFSPDGQVLLSHGYDDEPVLLWDLATERRIKNERLPEWAGKVEINKRTDNTLTTGRIRIRGTRVAARPNDGLIEFVDLDSEIILASLSTLKDQDWLVTTPNGFFDGLPEAWKQLRWRFNNSSFTHGAVELYFNDFFYPDLLQDVLNGRAPTPKAGREIGRIDRRQPKVSIVAINDQIRSQLDSRSTNQVPGEKRLASVVIEVSDNKDEQTSHSKTSGARDLRLLRNGSLVKVWHDDLFHLGSRDGCEQIPAPGPEDPRRVRCRVEVQLVAGENTFTAYAFNASNVKSEDDTVVVKGADALKSNGTLFVLAIGVNKYANKSLDLNFAVPDVVKMNAAIAAQQSKLRQDVKLQQYARFETITLTNEYATKENILLALRLFGKTDREQINDNSSAKSTSELRKIVPLAPEDALLIYFAGHGTSRGDRFYLLPHDFTGQSEALLDTQSVSDLELSAALEKVDAGRLLMVIDACQSGQVLGKENEGRAPMNSKGLAQLAYDKGMYILTAAQSQQAALEGVLIKDEQHRLVQIDNGLLTYVLLRAFRDREADKNGDNKLIDREWLEYSLAHVPQLQLEAMQIRNEENRGLLPGQKRAEILFVNNDGANTDPQKRGLQSPRIFYRREFPSQPFIVAQPLQR